MRRLALVSQLLLTMLLPCADVWAQNVTVNVFGQAWIKGEQALLGEIAVVDGSPAHLVESVKSVPIIKVPEVSRPQTINREYISLRLQQTGHDTSAIEVVAPDRIKISREARTVEVPSIRQAVEQYVLANLGRAASKARVEISGLEDDQMLPPGKVTFDVGAKTAPKYWGYARVPVALRVDGELKKTLWAKVAVSYIENVIVVKEPVRRGDIITEAMLEKEERDTQKLPHNVAREISEVVGKRAVRNLNVNDVVTGGAVEQPVLLKRGDKVSVLAEVNGLRVSVMAQAMENGAKGEIIKVRNLDSRKIFSVQVVDESSARVVF